MSKSPNGGKGGGKVEAGARVAVNQGRGWRWIAQAEEASREEGETTVGTRHEVVGREAGVTRG